MSETQTPAAAAAPTSLPPSTSSRPPATPAQRRHRDEWAAEWSQVLKVRKARRA